MFRSIRWRIAIPFGILILLIMLGLSVYLAGLVREAHLEDLRGQLAAEARLVANDALPLLIQPPVGEDLDLLSRRWGGLAATRVTIIAADGTVLGESQADRAQMDNHLGRPEVQQALARGQGWSIRHSRTENLDMMYVAVPVTFGGKPVGVVRLAVSLQQVEARVGYLRRAILAVTLPATIVAMLVAFLIAERTARPVHRLILAADRVAAGDYKARLAPSTRDEVGLLTAAFNRMADRLGEQMGVLATERGRLAGVLEHMADGVVIADGQGEVRLINPAAARLLSTRPEEALGHSVAQVLRHHRLVELWQRAAERGDEQMEAVEVERGGFFVQAIVTPIQEAEQQAFLLMLQDLTHIRRLETVRRDFLSNISHELRTPLASLKALADTLRDGALEDPPAARRFLDRVDVEVDAMAQMVAELLELARIESGQVPLRLRQVQVAEIAYPPVERLRPQADRAGLALSVDLRPDLPAVVVDAERMQQVVSNLVHNAIKFTPSGGQVTVSAAAEGADVVVAVRDSGVGIPAGDLPRIFERFYKVKRVPSGGGTGLGLAIAKHIVQAHGGQIWAESREGRGSTFHFSLPLDSGPQPPAA